MSEFQHADEIRRHLAFIESPHIMVAVLKATNDRMNTLRALFKGKGKGGRGG